MGAATIVASAMRRLHNGVGVPNYEQLLQIGYSKLVQPGGVVFDVGAHSGRHLEHFARLVGPQGRVFAFEPIPGLASYLARRYSANAAVTVKPLALSNRSGVATFRIVENGAQQSGLRQRDYGAASRVIRIPSNRIAAGILRRAINASGLGRRAFERGYVVVREITVALDTIDAQAAALDRLDYIKIDVEGAEVDCLRGAEATVSRHRPFISVEYGYPGYSAYGQSAMTLFEWARQNGYLLSDLFGNIVEGAAEWLSVCDVSYWDFFLLPQERRELWTARFHD
jgi:FkbM family methyltransferase